MCVQLGEEFAGTTADKRDLVEANKKSSNLWETLWAHRRTSHLDSKSKVIQINSPVTASRGASCNTQVNKQSSHSLVSLHIYWIPGVQGSEVHFCDTIALTSRCLSSWCIYSVSQCTAHQGPRSLMAVQIQEAPLHHGNKVARVLRDPSVENIWVNNTVYF